MEIGNIKTQRAPPLVGREKCDVRPIGRDAWKRRVMPSLTDARRLRQPGRTRSKAVTQLQRVIALTCNPVLPFLRQALATEEVADARSA